jgi:hypothetical protein
MKLKFEVHHVDITYVFRTKPDYLNAYDALTIYNKYVEGIITICVAFENNLNSLKIKVDTLF